MRPVLMLLGYNLFKADPQHILMPALGLETYHNYTLLHDDLMDNADLRRGHETVHKKWDANTAILSGDSMLVLAYQRMQQVDAPICHRSWTSSPRRPWRLARASSTTWTSRRAST